MCLRVRTDRVYIFDNSTNNADGMHTWLAEITDGSALDVRLSILDLRPLQLPEPIADEIKGLGVGSRYLHFVIVVIVVITRVGF